MHFNRELNIAILITLLAERVGRELPFSQP
jgi:hypothetical protein